MKTATATVRAMPSAVISVAANRRRRLRTLYVIGIAILVSYPMWRRPSTMFRREAWYAGKIALIRPTRAATASAAIYVGALTLKPPKKVPFGIFEITISNRDAAEAPIRPPSKEIVTASLK